MFFELPNLHAFAKKAAATSMLALFATTGSTAFAQKVKNVILLIPDGCSLATMSTARWYQWYNNPDKEFLYIDPYLSGTVRTTCSNAPIGDSAPTTSCYMTGYNQLAGWVSTYPVADEKNDIYPMDPAKAYQPLTTLFEAARIMYGKSTGLVCTCEFPHATPADCTSHSYDRGKYDWIIPQQVHNGINVLIGGGAGLLPKESEEFLKNKGYGVFRNDIQGMRSYQGDNMWALYGYSDMSYDIDRDPAKQPAIDEMTKIAIEKLSHNPNGFFLMVEGSKVDWAAHDNDPIAMATDFLAFDRACHEAFEFAKRDGNTAVIVVPDHGNSGLSIGRRDQGDYAHRSKDQLFGALNKMKLSAPAMADKINKTPFEDVQKVFKEYCGFELSDRELKALKQNREYKMSPVPKEERKPFKGSLYNSSLSRMIAQFMTERTGLAFTTNGHTGEDVFLASYHPDMNFRARGMITNIQLNEYMCKMIGTTHDALDSLTTANFAPHTEVLGKLKCEITMTKHEGKDAGTLNVAGKYKGKQFAMTIHAGSNIVEVKQGKATRNVELPSVVVYVDKNKTFYLKRDILDYVLVL